MRGLRRQIPGALTPPAPVPNTENGVRQCGYRPWAEQKTEIRQARPANAPFDLIVDVPPEEDTGPWEIAGATWAVTDFGLQPNRSAVLAVINDGPS